MSKQTSRTFTLTSHHDWPAALQEVLFLSLSWARASARLTPALRCRTCRKCTTHHVIETGAVWTLFRHADARHVQILTAYFYSLSQQPERALTRHGDLMSFFILGNHENRHISLVVFQTIRKNKQATSRTKCCLVHHVDTCAHPPSDPVNPLSCQYHDRGMDVIPD